MMDVPPRNPLAPSELDHDATRRRIRQLHARKLTTTSIFSVIGLTTTAVVVVVASSGGHPSSARDMLGVTSVTATPTPAASFAPRKTETTLRASEGTTSPVDVSTPSLSPSTTRTERPTDTSQTAAASARPNGSGWQRAPMTAGPVLVTNDSALCSTQVRPGSSWCPWLTTSANASGGTDLILEVCRPTQQGNGDLDYGTSLETDFTLKRSGQVIWRWSRHQIFPTHRHSVVVGTGGQCYRWQTRFDGKDDAGRRITGTVTLVGHSASTQLRGDDQIQELTLN